jgi:cyclic pyranopterin phosphate synthase
VTVSLDTLVQATFERLTRRDELARVRAGLEAALRAGFRGTKLNAVIMRGVNEHELAALIDFGRSVDAEVRFIEYMDVGGATRWRAEDVVTRGEILERLTRSFGAVEPLAHADASPAERYRLADGTVFGIIASTSSPFCASCDRSRLTADGVWYTCLYAQSGTDLRGPLRRGASREELEDLILGRWRVRADRGAEERLAAHARGSLVPVDLLRSDPHLEMHTRGG